MTISEVAVVKQIGFSIDKQGYKRTILCLLGLHKASKYIIERIDGEDYFVCSRCGKRYKIFT